MVTGGVGWPSSAHQRVDIVYSVAAVITDSFIWAPVSLNQIKLNFHRKEKTFQSLAEVLLEVSHWCNLLHEWELPFDAFRGWQRQGFTFCFPSSPFHYSPHPCLTCIYFICSWGSPCWCSLNSCRKVLESFLSLFLKLLLGSRNPEGQTFLP